uniref:Lysocardiolipin acyltransferase 1 n=1 Tax=Hucho hucho TaxID=62062 RepID=A0A4W5PPZ2_9TELE
MAVSVPGLYFVVSLFPGSFLDSILIPVLPLMLMSPAWYSLFYHLCLTTVALLELVFGVKVHSVIIMNHRTRLDWMFLWCCLLRYSYLRLEKIYLKVGTGNTHTHKHVHTHTSAWVTQCFIFIKRQWEEDHSHMENMLEYFCDIREPLQLLLFPEGTDLTVMTAENNDLPKLEYVLQHHTTGFTFIVDSLRKGKNLDAVHDITVAYPKNIPQTPPDPGVPLEDPLPRVLLRGLHPPLPTCRTEHWAEREVRLSDLYAAEPRGFPQGVCCMPPVRRNLWLWVPLRLYFLVMMGVYFGQKLIGGLEILELACHLNWKSVTGDKKKKVVGGNGKGS